MTGVILMTALPPTKGHAYLIEWARSYCKEAGIRNLSVLVCGSEHEPISETLRAILFRTHFDRVYGHGVTLNFIPLRYTLPDKPPIDNDTFLMDWAYFIKEAIPECKVLFGSDDYGYGLAESMSIAYSSSIQYVPCDPDRTTVWISATSVRESPLTYFSEMLPVAQKEFRKTITLFGQESTGKTTLAKALAYSPPHGHYLAEWARPYLEGLPPPHETTEANMYTIAKGQAASETAALSLEGRPFIIRDTDLLSTIGFYRLYGWDESPARDRFIPADHYLLMKDNIPFAPDRLRYGVDKRESPMSFWEDLLKEFHCNYTIIESALPSHRYLEAITVIKGVFLDHPIWGYKRT